MGSEYGEAGHAAIVPKVFRRNTRTGRLDGRHTIVAPRRTAVLETLRGRESAPLESSPRPPAPMSLYRPIAMSAIRLRGQPGHQFLPVEDDDQSEQLQQDEGNHTPIDGLYIDTRRGDSLQVEDRETDRRR